MDYVIAKAFALGDAAVVRNANLPPIAQKAQQEGGYLANCFNTVYCDAGDGEVPLAPSSTLPFKPFLLGSMASIGTTTLEGYVDMTAVGNPHGEQFKVTKFSGALAWLSWHSVYLLLRQKSFKNRLLICMYWFKTFVFGRDISRF